MLAIQVAIYARVSSDQQAEAHTIESQVAALRERGVEVSQDGAWGRIEVAGRFAYLDTDAHGGLSIELLWSK